MLLLCLFVCLFVCFHSNHTLLEAHEAREAPPQKWLARHTRLARPLPKMAREAHHRLTSSCHDGTPSRGTHHSRGPHPGLRKKPLPLRGPWRRLLGFLGSEINSELWILGLEGLVRLRVQDPEGLGVSLDDCGLEWLPSQISRIYFGLLLELLHVRDANLEVFLVGPEDLERSSGWQEPSVLAQRVPFELGQDILGELFPFMA